MTYWDVLDLLHKDGRVNLCTALNGPSTGTKTLLKEGETAPENSYCETLQNHPRLFVFGGGHVGAALLQLAAYTNLACHLIEPRPVFADPARHPKGTTIHPIDYEAAFEHIHFLPSDYLCIMTPGHQQDIRCALLSCRVEVAYRGMMGSRGKVKMTGDRLREAGIDEALIEGLHAPIGLAIGAQTPAEIAVSILAEIIQCYRKNACSALETDVEAALTQLRHPGSGEAVMCTIIQKHGSGPREVGTRMLVAEDGRLLAGTIGGGEVEAHALRRATQLLAEESDFALESYNMSSASAASIGMVCGGSALVMFERLQPPRA